MPTVRTDDEARRQRVPWLGPDGFRMPFDANGGEWMRGVGMAMAFIPLVYVLTPFIEWLPAWGVLTGLLHAIVAVTVGAGAAIKLNKRINKVVTPSTPARHHLETIAFEIRTPRPVTGRTTTAITFNPTDIVLEQRPEHSQIAQVAVPNCVTNLTESE